MTFLAYLSRFFKALVITEVIEISTLLLMVKFFLKDGKTNSFRIIFVGFVCSFATLPYLWFVLPPLIDMKRYVLVVELGAVLFEAVIISQFLSAKYSKSLLISFVCNSLSYFLGKMLL